MGVQIQWTGCPSHSTVNMGVQIQWTQSFYSQYGCTNTMDSVILQSIWVYKYNRQDVLVILQSIWVYKYNGLSHSTVNMSVQIQWTQSFYSQYGCTNTMDSVILQSIWVYKYNGQDVLVILQLIWVYKYNGLSHSTVNMGVQIQ